MNDTTTETAKQSAKESAKESASETSSETTTGAAAGNETGGTKPYKLLVVDDEQDVAPMFRQSMRPEIRKGQYTLVFASSGVEALELLEEEPDVDLLITDINMPDMDGLTLLKEIGQQNKDLKAVVLSAYGDMKNIRTAMSLGAADFCTKPVDFDDMKETIERTLRSLEQHREAHANEEQLLSLRQELDLAARIQSSVLPAEMPEPGNYQIDARVKPAREVSGDFYDVMRLNEARIGLVVADVSDKGVPAALFMMACRTLLRGAAIGVDDPGQVLQEVNTLISRDNEEKMFMTVFFGILDPATGVLSYANGGHPSPVLANPAGETRFVETSNNLVLGLSETAQYHTLECRLEPGDLAFIYSDGITEAFNSQDDQFGEERLAQAMADAATNVTINDARQCTDRIIAAVEQFAGNRLQTDDITCLSLKRTG